MLPDFLHLPKFGVINDKIITSVTVYAVVAAVHTDCMVDLLLLLACPLAIAGDLVLLKVFLCVSTDISSTMH